MLRRSVSSAKLEKATRKWLRPPARFIDRLQWPRLPHLTGATATRAMAIVRIVLSLGLPATELVPFSANGVGAGLVAFGLSLIARDGLLAMIGFILAGGTAASVLYALL